MQQHISNCGKVIPHIIDSTKGIKLTCSMSDPNKEYINKKIVNEEEHCQHTKNMKDNYIVVEILNDIILKGLPTTSLASEYDLQTKHCHNVEVFPLNISYKSTN